MCCTDLPSSNAASRLCATLVGPSSSSLQVSSSDDDLRMDCMVVFLIFHALLEASSCTFLKAAAGLRRAAAAAGCSAQTPPCLQSSMQRIQVTLSAASVTALYLDVQRSYTRRAHAQLSTMSIKFSGPAGSRARSAHHARSASLLYFAVLLFTLHPRIALADGDEDDAAEFTTLCRKKSCMHS